MERWGLTRIRLFSSDLDGTLAGDRAAARRFADWWQNLPLSGRPVLVYNSGRLLEDMAEFVPEQGLPEPDYLIGGVGTMLSGGKTRLADDFRHALGSAFDRARIADVLGSISNAVLQPAKYQHSHKSSWYLHHATDEQISEIEQELASHGLGVKLIYSSQRDLDVLPQAADKGEALRWLCGRLDIPLSDVVVAGDTGNDASMFRLPEVRGILPANARDELTLLARQNPLIYRAHQPIADGVLEGLIHFGVSGQSRVGQG
jgi:mannosylfructose-6-phosphate phosphatase